MNSTQREREEVSFSLPAPTKEENQRLFSGKKILKFYIKFFFKQPADIWDFQKLMQMVIMLLPSSF